MAHIEGETSNRLFEILAEWHFQLNHCYSYESSLDDDSDELGDESDDFEDEEPKHTPVCKPGMGRR